MKTLKNLAFGLLGVLVAVLFTACPIPQGQVSITIDPAGNLTVKPGQVVTWNVTLTPDSVNKSTLGKFYVLANNDTVFATDLQNSSEPRSFQVNYTVPADAQNGQQITVTFIAYDGVSGLQSSLSVTLTVEAEYYVESDNITFEYVSTSLDNQMMLLLSKDGYQLRDGEDTLAQIAYIYVGDQDNLIHNTLASPNAYEIADAYSYNGIEYTTDDKQITFFKRVTGQYTWDAITKDDVDNLTVNETNTDYIGNSQNLGYGVSPVEVGDIVAFYNPKTNVKGFIYVTYIEFAKNGAKITAHMTVDVKYVVYPSETAK
jgi:hypothetical protein